MKRKERKGKRKGIREEGKGIYIFENVKDRRETTRDKKKEEGMHVKTICVRVRKGKGREGNQRRQGSIGKRLRIGYRR